MTSIAIAPVRIDTIITIEFTQPIKPYVRMTQRSKWAEPQAQQYFASRDRLRTAFRDGMEGLAMFPDQTPFSVEIYCESPRAFTFDLDNLVKAILDAAQGVVFEDDRYCTYIRASKHKATQTRCHITVYALIRTPQTTQENQS